MLRKAYNKHMDRSKPKNFIPKSKLRKRSSKIAYFCHSVVLVFWRNAYVRKHTGTHKTWNKVLQDFKTISQEIEITGIDIEEPSNYVWSEQMDVTILNVIGAGLMGQLCAKFLNWPSLARNSKSGCSIWRPLRQSCVRTTVKSSTWILLEMFLHESTSLSSSNSNRVGLQHSDGCYM